MLSDGHTLGSGANTTHFVKELSLTATQIALRNFEWRYVTLVLFNSTLWCGVEIFLQSYRQTTIVGKGTFFPKFSTDTRQYVIFGLTVADIVHELSWITNHEFDNTGKFIIVCQTQNFEDCDETKAVEALWEYKVTNVVFLRNIEGVEGFSYFPLNDSHCKNNVPVKLNNLNSCFNESHYKTCRDIFAVKIKNFNKCPLIASSFIQPPYMEVEGDVPRGANGDLLVVLAERLNASLRVVLPRVGAGWGKLEEDGSWSGSLADVYYDYANLSITSAALTLSRFSYFHMSVGYNIASVVWVTHPPIKMSASVKLTHPFQPEAQIAILFCFMFVILYAVISNSKWWRAYGHVSEENRPRCSIVFYSWMICMGLPSTKMPTKPAYQYMVVLWMWFCVLIRTFYQVTLITVLKTNYYFGQLETIGDVVHAGYAFGGGAALKDYFIDYPLVYHQWTDLKTDDIIPMMRNVSNGVQFVVAMSMETAQTIIGQEELHVQILPEKIVSCPTVIFYKKFSPIAASVNNILVKLIEAGFSDKFKKNYVSQMNVKKVEDRLEAINLEHYTGCYMILVTGWITSFILFIGEMLIYKINNRIR